MAQPTGVTAIPRTFGILSVVFGSLLLVGGIFGMFGLIVPVMAAKAPPSRPADAEALKMLSSIYLGMGIISSIFVVMSALLLALGIGQLRYRKWAAVWSPRWAIVALGALVVMAILLTSSLGTTMSAFGQVAHSPNPDAGKEVGTALGVVYAAMMFVFYSPYPILLLVYFTRDRVRAAMTA